jgi:hypothetical protein
MTTHAPLTEAYLERMKRRDDPNHHSVCEHNWYADDSKDASRPRWPSAAIPE